MNSCMKRNSEMKVFLAAVLCICFCASVPYGYAETNDSVLRARVHELRAAVQRCKQRIASGELTDCLVRITWEKRTVTMSEASEIAKELEPVNGTWFPWGKFSQINYSCRQIYICRPSHSVMYGSNLKLVTTPYEGAWGTCSSAGGDPTACDYCSSVHPKIPCTWHLERK